MTFIKVKIEACIKCKKSLPVWKRTSDGPLCKKCCSVAIRKISPKQSARNAQYSSIRKEFMKEHPYCQAQLIGCTFNATECHHSAGRVGQNMLDQNTFIALCSSCHRAIHNSMSAAQARSLGLKR